MEGVSFEQENSGTPQLTPLPSPGITGMLVARGFAKDKKGAEYLLIILAGLVVLSAALIIYAANRQVVPTLPPGATIITPPGEGPRLLEPLPR
jgi:hypothetical protein